MSKYAIRELTTLEEMRQVEQVQRAAWDAPTTVVYSHMLISFARNGGSVLGAFDGGRIIAFLLSYLGLESPEAERPAMANLKLVSQRMAVLPEYRNSGIGYDLKVAQRNFAVHHGLRLITWTFDPLQSRNGYLNIRKLGAIVREYHRDYYGTEESPLTTLGASDRFMVEWWVTNNRVEQRIDGKRSGLNIEQYLAGNSQIVNTAQPALRGYLQPGSIAWPNGAALALIEIPDNINDIRDDDPDLGQAWQEHTRLLFEQLFADGYVITDFVHGEHQGRMRSFYVVSHGDVALGRL